MSDNMPNGPARFGKMDPTAGFQPPPQQQFGQPPAQPAAPYPNSLPAPPADPGPTAPVAAADASDPILFTIGDLAVSKYWVVTPNGTAPLAGSTWIGQDMSRTEKKIPTWAIIMAIVGFLLCLVGLLFLLVKEEQTTGYFEVTVQSGSVRSVSQLPVSSAAQVLQYRQLVHQAQSMAAAAALG